MSIAENDPRVFFSSERTLLAWIRTGLTIMALGFVVSRFGLFMQLLRVQSNGASGADTSTQLSALLGMGFVIAGSACIVIATLQHSRFVASLPVQDLPRPYSRTVATVVSLFISTLGLALAGYLYVAQ